jgi:hypothetical protein
VSDSSSAPTNPQDAACDQSLDVTHDEYCSTEMSSVGPYRRARHVATGHTRVYGMSDSDHRLHVKRGSALLHTRASIRERPATFGHWFVNLDAISKSFSLSISSFSSSSFRVHSSCPTLDGRMRTQKSSTTNKQSKSMVVCERSLRERKKIYCDQQMSDAEACHTPSMMKSTESSVIDSGIWMPS